jgi:acyl dehydratase
VESDVVLASVADIEAVVGRPIGPGEWLAISQERIDGFADSTNDHQWIHVDPDRARSSAYGATIAHGFLTLSLVPFLVGRLRRVENLDRAVNYGLNKVRFPAPVLVGSRVRAQATITECERIATHAVQFVSRVTIDIDGLDKPACVCETVSRYYFRPV